jgi:hypothetical protein
LFPSSFFFFLIQKKCNTQNFRKKIDCYGCGAPRDPDAPLVPANYRRDDAAPACPVIVLRNIDLSASESFVADAVRPYVLCFSLLLHLVPSKTNDVLIRH